MSLRNGPTSRGRWFVPTCCFESRFDDRVEWLSRYRTTRTMYHPKHCVVYDTASLSLATFRSRWASRSPRFPSGERGFFPGPTVWRTGFVDSNAADTLDPRCAHVMMEKVLGQGCSKSMDTALASGEVHEGYMQPWLGRNPRQTLPNY
jgi:hypothetical protein